jgi:hypothetical protein
MFLNPFGFDPEPPLWVKMKQHAPCPFPFIIGHDKA